LELSDENVNFVDSKFLKKRNVGLSLTLTKGDYMILIEQEVDPDTMKNFEKNPRDYSDCLDISLSVYGVGQPAVIGLSPEDGRKYFNFLLYQNQKNIGDKIWKGGLEKHEKKIKARFALPLKVRGMKHFLDCFVIRDNGTTFYLIGNKTKYGFRLKVNFEQKDGEEVVGPKGKISLKQRYKIESGESDVFIFRRFNKFKGEGYMNEEESNLKTMKIWSTEVEIIGHGKGGIDERVEHKENVDPNIGAVDGHYSDFRVDSKKGMKRS